MLDQLEMNVPKKKTLRNYEITLIKIEELGDTTLIKIHVSQKPQNLSKITMFKQCFAQIKRKTKIQILKNELNFKTKISIISKYLITLVYKSFRCCRLWIDLGVPKNKKSQENERNNG
jgi:hypothetical protein